MADNLDYWYDAQIRRYLTQFMRIFSGFKVSEGMRSGSTYYNSTIKMNVSSGNVTVSTTKNQTSYVITIANNVGNGGSIHGNSLFTGGGISASHPAGAWS